jgi:hypothetical protein
VSDTRVDALLRLRAVLGAIAVALTVMLLTASDALADTGQLAQALRNNPGSPVSTAVGILIIVGFVLVIAFTAFTVWWSIRSRNKRGSGASAFVVTGAGVAPLGGAPAAQQTDVADQLTNLVGLRDRGVLTAAEFEAQKQKLLGA